MVNQELSVMQDTQDFDEDVIPDVVTLDSGKCFSNDEGKNMFRKEGTSKIMIHPLQGMLAFHNINFTKDEC